jgi:predicted amidohydrolase
MRIACVQAGVEFDDPAANSAFAVTTLHELRKEGVDLAIFPEAFLTGYCVASAEAAEDIALPYAPGDDLPASLSDIRLATESLGMGCIVGFLGRNGNTLYNAAMLFEPGFEPRMYVKTHLPFLGYDRFATPGVDLPVFETRWGKIGIIICYDLRLPETARTLALKGAELIVLPTNWPVGAEMSAEHIAITRAVENRVFLATCNRVGVENGVTFIGQSRIVDPKGTVLAYAGAEPFTIYGDIDLAQARDKVIVNIPGEYEMALFGCRQPELYRVISAPMN